MFDSVSNMNQSVSKRPFEKQRAYGIDLLKICAMFAIVATHIIRRGGWGLQHTAPAGTSVIKIAVLEFMDAALLCHVNCFILASGWVMSKKEFKLSRIVRLWLQVWGYSVAFLLAAALFLPQIQLDAKTLTKCLLPLSCDSYWFFTQYLGLFFLMPVLNSAVKNLNAHTLRAILLAGFALFSIHPMLFGYDIFHVNHGYGILWFSYLYLFAATMAQHDLFSRTDAILVLSIALVCVFASVAGQWVMEYACLNLGIASRNHMFSAYNSPIIFVQSVSIFVLFSRLHLSSTKLRGVIAFVAPSVFAVYLLHSNFIFRQATHWDRFWNSALGRYHAIGSIVVVFCGAAVVFVSCLSVDFLRRGIRRAFIVKK